jgi:hypothetical protein
MGNFWQFSGGRFHTGLNILILCCFWQGRASKTCSASQDMSGLSHRGGSPRIAMSSGKFMGLSENSVPLNPMVLLIIIPMKNGYFIGNIPYDNQWIEGFLIMGQPHMHPYATISYNLLISSLYEGAQRAFTPRTSRYQGRLLVWIAALEVDPNNSLENGKVNVFVIVGQSFINGQSPGCRRHPCYKFTTLTIMNQKHYQSII